MPKEQNIKRRFWKTGNVIIITFVAAAILLGAGIVAKGMAKEKEEEGTIYIFPKEMVKNVFFKTSDEVYNPENFFISAQLMNNEIPNEIRHNTEIFVVKQFGNMWRIVPFAQTVKVEKGENVLEPGDSYDFAITPQIFENKLGEGRYRIVTHIILSEDKQSGNKQAIWAEFEINRNAKLPVQLTLPPNRLGNLNGKEMPLVDLRTLATKGDALVAEDFEEYKSINVSSNLQYANLHFSLAHSYEIPFRFNIQIDEYGKVLSTRFWCVLGCDNGIDIRFEDIDHYIKTHLAEATEYSISLHDLYLLAQKGDSLVMKDFEKFKGIETGSGLYIVLYTVENGYSLSAGYSGAWDGEVPIYVSLRIPGVEETIDIRTNDVSAFISKYHVPDVIRTQIHDRLDVIMSSPSLSSATGDYINAHRKEYNEIVAMGYTALPTLNEILRNGDKGLRGNISAIIVNNIIQIERSKIILSDWCRSALNEAEFTLKDWNIGFTDITGYCLN